jgi:hypothetical protein
MPALGPGLPGPEFDSPAFGLAFPCQDLTSRPSDLACKGQKRPKWAWPWPCPFHPCDNPLLFAFTACLHGDRPPRRNVLHPASDTTAPDPGSSDAKHRFGSGRRFLRDCDDVPVCHFSSRRRACKGRSCFTDCTENRTRHLHLRSTVAEHWPCGCSAFSRYSG